MKVVNFIHEHGFAHYDLKTENIFVDANYNLKLGDFGAATKLINPPPKIAGTLSYRAPEYP